MYVFYRYLGNCATLTSYLQMEKEDISFLREAAPIKTESTFDLHAFDADGIQMSFKIKAHVSSHSWLSCRVVDQI